MSTSTNNSSFNDQSYRDSISTITSDGKRSWIFPLKPSGKYYNLRTYFTWIYLLVFFLLPFIKLNEEPLFLFDVANKKFILFGAIFWPQDFFIFMIGMIAFIIFVALFTVVFGRLFCGWACPQTIFMEMIFRKIEYFIEGDAAHQKKLKESPWTQEKILKRSLKLILFFSLSFLIVNTFLSYSIGLDKVLGILSNPSENIGSYIGILIFTSIFFFVYWWFREQVCIIVCPYGRMQGVLLDKNSIVVAYDYKRGEPRKKIKRNENRDAGDCIDCELCVKVCPTGIDIRHGTQLECINCTACIDACDGVMNKIGFNPGLIRYSSENNIKNNIKMRFTTRIKAYSVVLFLLIGLEVFLLASRSDFDATILRAKGMLYQEQPNNELSNLYTIKLVNKTRKNLPIDIKVANITDCTLKFIGKEMVLKPEGISEGEFFIYVNKDKIKARKTVLQIVISSNGKVIKTVKTNFLGPVKLNSKS
jgi:cytochrome c oxidase accessory protein FixG